jgi:6-pyruvoyltetrahydropterin/6-carboxytetrahydropterin synthase
MLSKHPSLCKYPHGHSRRIDVVLAASQLDGQDMVCDFKALKLALKDFIDRFDHSLAVNSNDPILSKLSAQKDRLVVFENTDPTTEVMAKVIFEHLDQQLRQGKTYKAEDGATYAFPLGVMLERVRVTETASTWAEFGVS